MTWQDFSRGLLSHPEALGIYDANREGVLMHRTAFPRLYVPPQEEAPVLPHVPVIYQGKRSTFGPVTVYCVAETKEIVSHKDWRGDEAVALAREMLWDVGAEFNAQERHEAFAREVLSKLPWDGWELSKADIRKWYDGWSAREEEARWSYPPTCDPDAELPGPEDEARMLELVKKLGR